jgi:hypothetical protein
MHRESIFVCTYTGSGRKHVAHVRAWSSREAAETFARELELERDEREVPVAQVSVRPVVHRGVQEEAGA